MPDLQQLIDRYHAAQPAPTSIATPKAAAIRATYTLRSLLADLGAADRAHVLNLLKEEILALPTTASCRERPVG